MGARRRESSSATAAAAAAAEVVRMAEMNSLRLGGEGPNSTIIPESNESGRVGDLEDDFETMPRFPLRSNMISGRQQTSTIRRGPHNQGRRVSLTTCDSDNSK